MPFLYRSYSDVQLVIQQLNNNYVSNISALALVVRICEILHSVLHILFYIILLTLTTKYLSTSENWIRECLDMMASTSLEMSNGCLKYYRMLKEEN